MEIVWVLGWSFGLLFANIQSTFYLFNVDILLGRDGPSNFLNELCHLGDKKAS